MGAVLVAMRQLEHLVSVRHPEHATDGLLDGATERLDEDVAVRRQVHGYLR